MDSKQKKFYRGDVCSVLRDINTLSPKVLLQNVTYEDGTVFRDHVWVPYTKKMEKVRPKNTKYTTAITFRAYEKEYPSTSGGTKLSLVQLSYIIKVKE